MRDHGASFDPSAVQTSKFPLPDADSVAAAWSETSPAGALLPRPDKAKTVSVTMLLAGAALLFFVPLGGALLLAGGGVGLAISSEALTGGRTTTANQPSTSSSTND